MIDINILPPKIKQDIKISQLMRLLKQYGLWLTGIVCVFCALIYFTNMALDILLQEQRQNIVRRQQEERTQELVAVENRIEQVNSRLNNVVRKQENMVMWTPIFEELSNLDASGLSLNNLNYQASVGVISLTGFASSRDKLIRYQEKLQESEYFIDLESPLANVIKQTDIIFSITLKPVIK